MKCNHGHILVVDDDEDTADSMARLLCLWGYDGEACYDGAAALRSAGVRRPAAVLLDLDMPRMDGYEFARRLRELRKGEHVPIVAITGCTSGACQARARKGGIGDYLFKPADPGALRKLLAAITFRPHMRSLATVFNAEYGLIEIG